MAGNTNATADSQAIQPNEPARPQRFEAVQPWLALAVVLLTTAFQLCVGTFGGAEGGWRIDRAFHRDYWYYAGLARSVLESLLPQNPAFSGELLTQYAYHLLPLGAAARILDAYVAMRLLNVVYAGLLLLLLRRYFPSSYGLAGLALLFTSPVAYVHNPIGIDLLTRGFHHAPFVLLALIGLFETRDLRLRGTALFLLPWAHGLMTLSFGPALLFVLWRQRARLILPLGAGFFLAAAMVSVTSGGQAGGRLLESLTFAPWEVLLRFVPLGACLAVAGRKRPELLVLAGTAVLASSVIGWNRYYFLFPLDFALALATALAAHDFARGELRHRFHLLVIPALLLFAIYGHRQVNHWVPYDGHRTDAALRWIEDNTAPDAVFLQASAPPAYVEDAPPVRENGHGYPLVAQRDLYVAYGGWPLDLGIDPRPRIQAAHDYFSGGGALPAEIDFVFYGPMEKTHYPDFEPRSVEAVYEDEEVTIYQAR